MRPKQQYSPAPTRHVVALGVLMLAFVGGFVNGVRRGVDDAGHVERLMLPAVASPMVPSR